MQSRELFSIGASLLGVHLVVANVVALPKIVTAHTIATATDGANPTLYTLAVATQLLLSILIGAALFLYFRPHGSADNSDTVRFPMRDMLFAGIKLMGAYLLISGGVELFANAGEMALVPSRLDWFGPRLTSSALQAVAGFVLILRATWLAELLDNATRQSDC